MASQAVGAMADVVHNDVVANGNDTFAPGGSTTIDYFLEGTTGTGDASGCNATGGAPVTFTPHPAAGVTVSPASASVSGCNNNVPFTFSAASAGNYQVTVSATGGKSGSSYSTTTATFTLHVKVTNTAPSVTVSGPANGANYEKGSVPAASCNVTDAEDGNSTKAATLSAVSGPLASYGLGSQTASCSYTDQGGLTANASVTYSVVDTTAPTLSVPGDITKEATSSSGATASWTASATDAVDPSPAVSCAPNSGSTFALGSTVVNCTATDEVGNVARGQFNVVVQDTTKPVLALPADQTVEAAGPAGAAVTYSAAASDTVDGAITPSCAPTSGSTFALGRTPVNCSATDKSSNTATGGFNVTVRDTTAPALHLPANATLEATGPNGTQFTYNATANDIVDGTDAVSCDSPSGTVFGLGATTVSCTATDAAGNLSSGSFTVTVRDTTAPTLKLPADITQEATKQAGADIAYDASASDIVDGNVAPQCSPANGTFAVGTTTVHCSATDAAGNSTSGSFTVTVTDTTPPAFSGVPADQTLEATGPNGAAATFTTPSATDIVDGSVPVSCDATSGDTFGLGKTTVTCSASDAHGDGAQTTFSVTVQDTTPPALSDLPDNQILEATGPGGAVATFAKPAATDIVDGTDPVNCDASSGDTFALGVHTVTCATSDGAGNQNSASFTITVRDTSAPLVDVPDNITKEATGPSGAIATFSASAYDTVDGNRPTSCDPQSGSTFELGATTVTCSASDLSGNTGQGGFTVTVVDTTPPSVTVPADITKEATGSNGATVSFATSASDIVDGSIAPTCTAGGDPVASGDAFPVGTTTVSCTATDQAGNTSAAKTFNVTVTDTTPPAVAVPADKTVEATGPTGAVVSYTASAADLVDGTMVPDCFPASGSTFPLGTTTVTCSATDAHANKGTASFNVTVQDKTAPVIGTLADISALATSASGAVVTYTANASDVVDGTFAATCAPASGSTFAPGRTTVSCTATDSHGNTSAPKTFTVSVGFDFAGFFAPVDTNKVLNGMKAGSTAPMKWQISNEKGGYISDLGIVSKTTSGVASCASGALIDDLSQYATGGTTLRYDSTANQFMYNWQSPKSAGSCYTVTIGLTDGSTHSATFQLK